MIRSFSKKILILACIFVGHFYVQAQEPNKATSLNMIRALTGKIIETAPITKYKLSDKAQDELRLVSSYIALFIARNGGGDTLLSSAMENTYNGIKKLIPVLKTLYGMRTSAQRNIQEESRVYKEYRDIADKFRYISKKLKDTSYYVTGKKEARELLVTFIDSLITITEKITTLFRQEAAEKAQHSSNEDEVTDFLTLAQRLAFDSSDVFKTPVSEQDKFEKGQKLAKWDDAISTVAQYIATKNKPESKKITTYWQDLRNLALTLGNTTKIINRSIFIRPNAVSGSPDSFKILADYKPVEDQAALIQDALTAPEFDKDKNIKGIKSVLTRFAFIIEVTAANLPKLFYKEVAKRNAIKSIPSWNEALDFLNQYDSDNQAPTSDILTKAWEKLQGLIKTLISATQTIDNTIFTQPGLWVDKEEYFETVSDYRNVQTQAQNVVDASKRSTAFAKAPKDERDAITNQAFFIEALGARLYQLYLIEKDSREKTKE